MSDEIGKAVANERAAIVKYLRAAADDEEALGTHEDDHIHAAAIRLLAKAIGRGDHLKGGKG